MGRSYAGLAVVAVAVVLAGCGGGERQEAPASGAQLGGIDRSQAAQDFMADELAGRHPSGQAKVPSGYRVRHSNADHVALAFPPRWQSLTSQDARWPGTMQMFSRLNRGLGAAIAALSLPDGPLKLLGFDPRTLHSYTTTASVMLTPARPGASYAEWSAQAIRATRRLPSIQGPVRARRVDHPLGDALRLEYVRRYGTGPRISTLQYVVTRGSTTYVVTYSTLPRLMARYAKQFAASALTLSAGD